MLNVSKCPVWLGFATVLVQVCQSGHPPVLAQGGKAVTLWLQSVTVQSLLSLHRGP